MTDLAITSRRLHQRQPAGSGRLVVGWAAPRRGVGGVRPVGAPGAGAATGGLAQALGGQVCGEPSGGYALDRSAAIRLGGRREQDDIGAGPAAGGSTP